MGSGWRIGKYEECLERSEKFKLENLGVKHGVIFLNHEMAQITRGEALKVLSKAVKVNSKATCSSMICWLFFVFETYTPFLKGEERNSGTKL